jgi:single-stranded-DNA-specific exonuclease
VGRGSARSVDGVDIHAAISAQPHLVEGGGGHPRAAGFAIRSENVDAFRAAVSRHVEEQLAGADAGRALFVTHPVAWRDVALPLAEQLERLSPFGAGNPRPLLRCEGLRFIRAETLGKDGRHQALYLQDAGGVIGRVIWWHSAGRALPEPDSEVALTFTLKRDVFKDKARAQVIVQTIEFEGRRLQLLSDDAQRTVAAAFVIRDMRTEADRLAALQALIDEHGRDAIQVWSHADKPASLAAFDNWFNRVRLQARPVLVIWDAPPGPAELAHGLERAEPQTVVLMNRLPAASDSVDDVMRQVRAMIATSERRGDSLDDPEVIARMAARVNQRDETIRATIEAVRNGANDSPHLRYLLEETRAYRVYAADSAAAELLRM